MAKKFPEIIETSAELNARMQTEKHRVKRQRLHTLYLVKSGQVQSRQQIAALLGVGHNAVGQWLACYARDGLDPMLAVQPLPGRVASLNAAQQAQVRQALADSQGFESYGAVQAWIETTFGVVMSYSAVHKLVRYKLGASLKVARPSHPKKTPRP